jgi:hypothetical protein
MEQALAHIQNAGIWLPGKSNSHKTGRDVAQISDRGVLVSLVSVDPRCPKYFFCHSLGALDVAAIAVERAAAWPVQAGPLASLNLKNTARSLTTDFSFTVDGPLACDVFASSLFRVARSLFWKEPETTLAFSYRDSD